MPWREILINHHCFSDFKNADRQKSKKFNGSEKNKEIDFFSHDHMTENMTTKIYFSFSHFCLTFSYFFLILFL